MEKIKIIFMGTPEFGLPTLEKLVEACDVVGVVCQPDKPSNRGAVNISKIKKFALDNNIRVFQPVNIKEEHADILKLDPDMIITCAYGQIIPKEILTYPKYGCINIHASLLPKLRGGAPIHRAIIEGHKESGITIMKMEQKMDAGDIIVQEKIPILDEDTAGTLHDKLSILARDTMIKTIPIIVSGNYTLTKQNESEVTYGFNITREDEHIDFHKTTREIVNRIRGLNPYPGSYSLLAGKIVKLWSAKYGNNYYSEALCGQVTRLYEDGIGIKTENGEVIITELQLEGKRKMSASEFINGVVNKDKLVGKIFE